MKKIKIKIDKEEFRKKLNIKDGEPGKPGENSQIPGPKGDPGKPGIPGKNGSPDTPDEVVDKVNTAKKKIKPSKIEGFNELAKAVDQIGSNPTGGGSAPLIIKNAGARVSEHVTDLNFSTGLTATYSGNGVVTLTTNLDSTYLKLDASNDPITGNVDILKSTPVVTLTDSGSSSYGKFTVTGTRFSIDFGLNGAEIPASINSDGTTITFSPTGVGGLTYSVSSMSFISGFAGINAVDYTINGDPATGGSNLDGGDITVATGAVTGSGASNLIIKVAGGNASGSTSHAATTVGTFAYDKVTLVDGYNLAVGTTTGSKIGTATSQKLGFWNATPIVQPTTSVGAATFTANAGTAVNDASTFDGYTLKQVVKALRDAGLLA